jgi:hypothetical protein
VVLILPLHYAEEQGIERGVTIALCIVRVLRFILEARFDECAIA